VCYWDEEEDGEQDEITTTTTDKQYTYPPVPVYNRPRHQHHHIQRQQPSPSRHHQPAADTTSARCSQNDQQIVVKPADPRTVSPGYIASLSSLHVTVVDRAGCRSTYHHETDAAR